jgi:DNA-directed RNA polymerase subunit omega
MARISVEDCLKKVPSRFALVMLAAARTKQLFKGSKPRVQADNKEVVLALREIAAGKVTPARFLEDRMAKSPDEEK